MKLKMIFVGMLLAINMYGGNKLSIKLHDNSGLNEEIKTDISTNPEHTLFFLTRCNKENKVNDHDVWIITTEKANNNAKKNENNKLTTNQFEKDTYTNVF